MYDIVYIAHSIYHILYATSLALRKNNETSEARQLCLIATPNLTLEEGIPRQLVAGFSKSLEFKEVSGLEGADNLSSTALEAVESFKKEEIRELVVFNQDNLLAVHLAQHFAARDALVALAQDALKPYAEIAKPALRYRSFRSWAYYRYCRQYGFHYRFLFISMRYGRFAAFSRLYLSHPAAAPRKDLPVVKAGLKQKVLEYLATSLQEELDFNRPTVFFSSSLMGKREQEWNFERGLLEEIANTLTGWQLVLKLHPRAKTAVREAYASIPGWQIIQNVIPAELYLSRLQYCVSMSSYSGTALYPGPPGSDQRRIWLYPLYEAVVPALSYLRINRPDPAIQLIKDHSMFTAMLGQLKSLDYATG